MTHHKATSVADYSQKVFEERVAKTLEKGAKKLEETLKNEAQKAWLASRDLSVAAVEKLLELGIHKQITNRLLEPFLWHTIICTATEWENFFNLRDHAMAQPEIRRAAILMKAAYAESTPRYVSVGHWHWPLVTGIDEVILLNAGHTPEQLAQISCARCARVSYLTHDGKRDPQKDLELCADLVKNGHMSPLEHAARAFSIPQMSGNFLGWEQYRKIIVGEGVFGGTA